MIKFHQKPSNSLYFPNNRHVFARCCCLIMIWRILEVVPRMPRSSVVKVAHGWIHHVVVNWSSRHGRGHRRRTDRNRCWGRRLAGLVNLISRVLGIRVIRGAIASRGRRCRVIDISILSAVGRRINHMLSSVAHSRDGHIRWRTSRGILRGSRIRRRWKRSELLPVL